MSTSLLSNATARFTVDTDQVTPGHTSTIQAAQLILGTDGERVMKFKFILDGTIETDFEVTLSDVNFEDYNIFGGKKTAADNAKLGGRF